VEIESEGTANQRERAAGRLCPLVESPHKPTAGLNGPPAAGCALGAGITNILGFEVEPLSGVASLGTCGLTGAAAVVTGTPMSIATGVAATSFSFLVQGYIPAKNQLNKDLQACSAF